MTEYVGLLLPTANPVYGASAPDLMLAELQIFNERVLGGRLEDLRRRTLGGVEYLGFRTDTLLPRDLLFLANMSSLYALFEVTDLGLLRPIELEPLKSFDSDLIMIPKYRGKTNEHFTKLLLNVTILSSDVASQMTTRRLRVLDPLAGRGTTLNQALMYGWDCAGIELDARSVSEYERFIGRYFKEKRLKHRMRSAELRRGGEAVGRRVDVEVGLSKEAFKAGDTIHLSALQAETREARSFFKAGSFDAVVTDLPYGVRHASGSRTPTSKSSSARRPLELLRSALPVWTELVRTGGAIGLAWNRHVAGREKVVRVLEDQGLEVMSSEPYAAFRHSVDQSILRDLVVARKGAGEVQHDISEKRS